MHSKREPTLRRVVGIIIVVVVVVIILVVVLYVGRIARKACGEERASDFVWYRGRGEESGCKTASLHAKRKKQKTPWER